MQRGLTGGAAREEGWIPGALCGRSAQKGRTAPLTARKGGHPAWVQPSPPHIPLLCTCTQGRTHTCTRTLICVHGRTRARIHTHTHTHTHTSEPCRCRKLTAQNQLQEGKSSPRPSPQRVFPRPRPAAPGPSRPQASLCTQLGTVQGSIGETPLRHHLLPTWSPNPSLPCIPEPQTIDGVGGRGGEGSEDTALTQGP